MMEMMMKEGEMMKMAMKGGVRFVFSRFDPSPKS